MNRVWLTRIGLGIGVVILLVAATVSFPSILVHQIESEAETPDTLPDQFPVTVNPALKTITENPQVEAFLTGPSSPLQAAAGNLSSIVKTVFEWIAVAVADAPWYQALAGANGRLVTLTPGMRKEQVANAFAAVLGWNATQKKDFITATPYSSLPLTEGSFLAGTYLLEQDTTPLAAQAAVNERFAQEVLARYGTTTAQVVPLHEALTIASLIEREAGGADDMRYISGIIWNRLFINMRLQIDATLQYAKANTPASSAWWPQVLPADLYRKSAYNTYLHKGLPPTPIASPSVAAVVAALNPKKTPCLFYFHDSRSEFHCTETYAEHVALLKKYYGRGN